MLNKIILQVHREKLIVLNINMALASFNMWKIVPVEPI